MELICKFYAKRPGDKKPCLLRDVAITENGEVLITDSKNRNIKVCVPCRPICLYIRLTWEL